MTMLFKPAAHDHLGQAQGQLNLCAEEVEMDGSWRDLRFILLLLWPCGKPASSPPPGGGLDAGDAASC